MQLDDNLKNILERYDTLGTQLSKGASELGDQFKQISKDYAALAPIVILINKLFDKRKELEDLNTLLTEEQDQDIKSMAEEEKYFLEQEIEKLTKDVQISILPKDKDDARNVILEIRAGTGGDEATLFVADLLRMYTNYAAIRKWKLEHISASDSGVKGYKEVICSISGNEVFGRLKFESGGHRVQRIPETETNGRIHTSAATVAVLPEAEDIDINIEDKDLKIDIYRASGAGGQHVNTTDSAVRITHIPTGIVVVQQDERSQHKNKAKALKILRARLYEHEKCTMEQQRSQDRKTQIGSGDRSERIRTYNFPQGRVTDHRINLTLYKLDRVILSGELDEILDAVIAYDQSLKLSQQVK